MDVPSAAWATDIDAVLFDKDGTLIDFARTWDPAIGEALRRSTPDDDAFRSAAAALGFDDVAGVVRPESPFVAEPNEVVEALLEGLVDVPEFRASLARTPPVPAHGAHALLDALVERGVVCGVVTNDDEDIARFQMAALGWLDRFGVVVGADSGLGAKPEPGPVAGACERLAVRPDRTLMVGDSLHDVMSGRRAGCRTVLLAPPGPAGAGADMEISSLDDLRVALGSEPTLGQP